MFKRLLSILQKNDINPIILLGLFIVIFQLLLVKKNPHLNADDAQRGQRFSNLGKNQILDDAYNEKITYQCLTYFNVINLNQKSIITQINTEVNYSYEKVTGESIAFQNGIQFQPNFERGLKIYSNYYRLNFVYLQSFSIHSRINKQEFKSLMRLYFVHQDFSDNLVILIASVTPNDNSFSHNQSINQFLVTDGFVDLNLNNLLPSNPQVYQFYNSALPKKCKQITWLYFKYPIEVSHQQFNALNKIILSHQEKNNSIK